MALSFSSFNTPVGNLAPTLSGSAFTATFNNTATFTNTSGSSCAPGEYRQYVMGVFMVNGSVLGHVLCGTTVLSATVYQEDGCPSGSCTAYGHRTCPPSDLDKYMSGNVTDQATGCSFTMTDAPGFNNVSPANSYTIDLSFQGDLINTTDASVMVSHYWTVSGMLPASTISTTTTVKPDCEAGGLQPGDRLVAVHAARNRISGALEAHVIVSRQNGQPPLAGDALNLCLKDQHGAVIATDDPEVHEVVCGHRATATFVHHILDEKRPVKAEVSADGANVALEVHHR